jgi:hypothetical protein
MTTVKLPKWATALDVLAIVMAAVSISVLLTGGFRVWFFKLELSVTGWWRPALWSAIAVAIRHALVRHRPLPQHVAGGVRAWWRHPDTQLAWPVLVTTRCGVFLVGFLAVLMIGYPDESPMRWRIYANHFLDLPARWDAGWYLGIAMQGYKFDPWVGTTVQQNIAFFPAFPMAMRYLSAVLGHQLLWTGVGISLVAFFLSQVYFLRLARLELGDEDAAAAGMTLLAAYPFAVFFSVPYTESLFLLTLLGAVYHFRRGGLAKAAIWGFICGLTRPNGFLLSIVIGLMALSPFVDRTRRRLVWPAETPIAAVAGQGFAAAAPIFGVLAYSAFVWQLTGHPFTWTAQNAAWGRVYRSIDALVAEPAAFIFEHGVYEFAVNQPINIVYWVVVLFAFAAVWPVYRRLGLPYAALILLTVVPPMLVGGLLSIGRITSVLFPVFMWLGAAVPARHRTAWIGLFALFQGFVAVMFFTWRPLY